MDTEVKIHGGCGPIYLRGWINFDNPRDGMKLLADDPNGIERNGTTVDRYFGKFADYIARLKAGEPADVVQSYVCDVFADLTALPFADASVDQYLLVQVWEHLSRREAVLAIAEARRVLKLGGLLRIGIPDFPETLRQSHEAYARGDHALSRFLDRHFFGSRKEWWAHHNFSWTFSELVDFLAEYGFEGADTDEEIRHDYPAITHRFRRVAASHHPEFDQHVTPWKAAYEYCGDPLGTPLTVPDDWKVLEVGPGNAPWPRADWYLDIVPHDWENFTLGNVQAMPFADGAFDYVMISHCLEHTDDPAKACRELHRVAKAGCIVCPSPFKEGLFCAHELDHKWWVFQSGDRLIFKRIPEGMYAKVYDSAISGQAHRFLRYGDPRLESLSYMARAWWNSVEPHCDVIHRWDESLPLKVEVLE